MSHLLSDTDLPSPVEDRWFEDYVPGSTYEFGHVSLTEDEIVTTMRLFVDHYISRVASLASPGLDEVRFVRPVRPGDELRLRATIDKVPLTASKPDRGLVHTFSEVLNQDDDVVLSFTALNFFAVRPGS